VELVEKFDVTTIVLIQNICDAAEYLANESRVMPVSGRQLQ
jgi:hypothetical protein